MNEPVNVVFDRVQKDITDILHYYIDCGSSSDDLHKLLTVKDLLYELRLNESPDKACIIKDEPPYKEAQDEKSDHVEC